MKISDTEYGASEIKVSVIVPIYNVEKYLHKSLESLANQTLKEIEILMVDDGSTDRSSEIAGKFAETHSNFHLVTKENGGLSSARNAGMDAAQGEYLAFVDSDDWVSEYMMEKLYTNAKKYDADMVMAGFERVDSHGNVSESHKLSKLKDFYQKQQVYDNILLPMCGGKPEDSADIPVGMSVWRNIYRRSLIEEKHIRFKSERVYLSEDIVFHMDLLPLVERVAVVHECLYFYRLNPQSLTQVFDRTIYDKQYFLYHYLKKKLQKDGYWKDAEFRLKRLFIGRVRNKLSNDLAFSELSIRKKWMFCHEIMKRKEMKELFYHYPVYKYKGKLLVSTVALKYSCTTMFLMMSLLVKRR